jgi:hypothetical protein
MLAGNEIGQTRVGDMENAAFVTTTLDTFITSFLQVDQQTPGGLAPDDANLFLGPDPADGTPSENVPAGPAGATYIDWQDLGGNLANHQLLDLNDSRGRDPSSFPGSNECVGPSNVLTKMDLTYIASANNNQFGYFAVQRSGNNGDAGYYWVFTKSSPHLTPGEAPCSADKSRLTYDIQPGDVLLAGHFHPNGTPLLRVFVANTTVNHLGAVSAIDYTSSIWTENAAALAAVAVNTTPTAPGAFGAQGVNAVSGGNLQPEIFAEAAVALSLFTGGASSCGQTYFGSVITRSSGSGGTSPDLKDLAGPAIFNFAGIVAAPAATVGCGLGVHIDAHAARPDGSAIPGVTCTWTLDSGTTPVSTNCVDDISVPAGSHTLHVTVTDPATSCNTTAATAPFSAAAPVTAAATLTPSCGHQFGFNASGSGSGALNYSWTFSGPGSITPPSSTAQSGLATTGSAGTYSAHLTVTDARGCSASDDKTTDVADALAATLSLQADCNKSFSYSANVSGGTGSPTYVWSFTPPSGQSVNPSTSTGSGGTATVSAAGDYGVAVTVTDARGCQANPSGTVHPYAPLSISLGFSSAGPACSTNSSAVTFNAQVTGGSGSGSYSWTGTGCGNVASCPYDNANDCATQPVSVSFTDPICGPIGPASLTYTKVTTVTVQ